MYSAGKGFLLIAIVTTPTMKFFMESWERKLIVATGNEANELYHVRRRETSNARMNVWKIRACMIEINI